MAALLNPMCRRLAVVGCRRISTPAVEKPLLPLVYHRSFQERYSSSLVDASGGFGEMLASPQRYYVFGGKGGVGKTSMAASLAVKFANHGEPTLIASTGLSGSLGDLFEQDMSDGKTVCISGFDYLFAVEIGHVKLKLKPQDVGSFINNLLGKMGLGTHSDILSMLNKMLSGMPPGIEEVFLLSELIKSIEVQGPDKLKRIVLDAPSTGHTLKILSASDWMENFLLLSIKGINIASSMPSFNTSLLKNVQVISDRLEELRKQIARVHEILFDPQSTEFIIVTIPMMMAVSESSRFHASLKKDGVHAKRLIVNQVSPPSASDCRFCAAKRREEARAFRAILEDRELGGLKLIQAQLLDMEVKGVPALRFLSDSIWK